MADQNNRKIDPNTRSSQDVGPVTEAMYAGVGGKKANVKTSGIKIRGTGAATKGTMARGPMA